MPTAEENVVKSHGEDIDPNKMLSFEEMEAFVASNSNLWSLLSVHFDISVEECQERATILATELATGRRRRNNNNSCTKQKEGISTSQFQRFQKQYIEDPEGQLEFFSRMLFKTFDLDDNDQLDKQELDKMLDILYKVNSHLVQNFHQANEMKGGILLGNMLLPPKDVMKRNIVEAWDLDDNKDNNGKMISLEEFLCSLAIIRKRNVKQMRKKGMNKAHRDEQQYRALVRAEVYARLMQSNNEVVEDPKK